MGLSISCIGRGEMLYPDERCALHASWVCQDEASVLINHAPACLCTIRKGDPPVLPSVSYQGVPYNKDIQLRQ